MKKENKAGTKLCPNCRKVIFKSSEFDGIGSFITRCPHCQTTILIQLTKKVLVGITIVSVFLLLLGIRLISNQGKITPTVVEEQNK